MFFSPLFRPWSCQSVVYQESYCFDLNCIPLVWNLRILTLFFSLHFHCFFYFTPSACFKAPRWQRQIWYEMDPILHQLQSLQRGCIHESNVHSSKIHHLSWVPTLSFSPSLSIFTYRTVTRILKLLHKRNLVSPPRQHPALALFDIN